MLALFFLALFCPLRFTIPEHFGFSIGGAEKISLACLYP
jgi:hypothetical protein